ncbi:MAG: cupin domain-containing protein [Synergistaceae bacterium]|jgi:mannose-6-phosphate isomerase-like protein (cupin superfamily)|nr:cupin domain-containing protein [Synergistaceae bacterium]
MMKHVVNVASDREPDTDPRSLRAQAGGDKPRVFRDTYYLIERKNGPSLRLSCGHTTVYPTGSTTGHAHDDMEEIYFFISGEGIMVVGEDKFPVKAGDACYVPPGAYHTTYQTGIMPLVFVWNTCLLDGGEKPASENAEAK